jgi:bacilysin biosynthesis protein BacA
MFIDLEKDMMYRFSLLREHLRDLRTLRLATLGPEGTSSDQAAKYFLDHSEISEKALVLCAQYEEAAEYVITGKADLLLVANAYKAIDNFYMAPALYFMCAYFFQTPVYGIAARKGWVPEPNKRYSIATHHAPISLVPWFLKDLPIEYDLIELDSTVGAARAAQASVTDLCVTNAVAVEKTPGLEFVTRTRPIRMLWSVFQRKRDD